MRRPCTRFDSGHASLNALLNWHAVRPGGEGIHRGAQHTPWASMGRVWPTKGSRLFCQRRVVPGSAWSRTELSVWTGRPGQSSDRVDWARDRVRELCRRERPEPLSDDQADAIDAIVVDARAALREQGETSAAKADDSSL